MSSSAKQSFCCAQHHLCFGHCIYLFLYLGRFPSQTAVTKQNITHLSQANLGIARAFVGGKKGEIKERKPGQICTRVFSYSVATEENVKFFYGKKVLWGRKSSVEKTAWILNGKKMVQLE